MWQVTTLNSFGFLIAGLGLYPQCSTNTLSMLWVLGSPVKPYGAETHRPFCQDSQGVHLLQPSQTWALAQHLGKPGPCPAQHLQHKLQMGALGENEGNATTQRWPFKKQGHKVDAALRVR